MVLSSKSYEEKIRLSSFRALSQLSMLVTTHYTCSVHLWINARHVRISHVPLRTYIQIPAPSLGTSVPRQKNNNMVMPHTKIDYSMLGLH